MFNNNENPSHDNDVLTVANRPSPSARILYNDVIIIMHDTIIIIIIHYYELTVSISGWGWKGRFLSGPLIIIKRNNNHLYNILIQYQR